MSDNTASPAGSSSWASVIRDTVAEEGGGNYYGRVHCGWGYKLYHKEVRNEDLWFPIDKSGDKAKTDETKKSAMADANRAVVKYGIDLKDKKIDLNFAMWINTSEMFGRDTSTWKSDAMWFSVVYWDANLKETIAPHMDKLGISPHIGINGISFWGKISQADDIKGYQKDSLDRDGNPIKVTKKIGYIAEVYADEAACRAAAEKEFSGRGTTAVAAAQSTVEDDILQVHKDDPSLSLYEIGRIFDKDVKDMASLLKYSKDQVTDDIKLLKGKDPDVTEVATFYGVSPVVVKRLIS